MLSLVTFVIEQFAVKIKVKLLHLNFIDVLRTKLGTNIALVTLLEIVFTVFYTYCIARFKQQLAFASDIVFHPEITYNGQ